MISQRRFSFPSFSIDTFVLDVSQAEAQYNPTLNIGLDCINKVLGSRCHRDEGKDGQKGMDCLRTA